MEKIHNHRVLSKVVVHSGRFWAIDCSFFDYLTMHRKLKGERGPGLGKTTAAFVVSVYLVIMLYVDSLAVTASFFPELELCDIGAETWEEHTVKSPHC